MRELFLSDIVDRLQDAQLKNNGKTPYGWVQREVRKLKKECPSIHITANDIFNEQKRRKRKLENDIIGTRIQRVHQNVTPTVDLAPNSQQSNDEAPPTIPPPPQPPPEEKAQPNKGGRPVGTTKKRKKNKELAEISAMNEICTLFNARRLSHKEKYGAKSRLPNGVLDDIIENVIDSHHLQNCDHGITKKRVRGRFMRNRRLHTLEFQGTESPLLTIEPKVVNIIIKMGEIREPLTPSKGLRLVNDLIKGTSVQKALINWKHASNCTQDPSEYGTLGYSYWYGFC